MGGVACNAVSTKSKIAVCKEISLIPSYFERKISGVEGIVEQELKELGFPSRSVTSWLGNCSQVTSSL